MENQDILIVGAGTAGLTAAIYVQRAGRHAIIFEKNAPGGQIVTANEIENFPGFASVNGADFAFKLYQQATDLGAEYVSSEVIQILPEENKVTVKTKTKEYTGRALVYAAGAAHRKLGFANEEKLIGKGISFCANCDGAFYKGKVVAVNGGGNIALDDAAYLSKLASKVYLIHRREQYRAEKVVQDRLIGLDNVEPLLSSVITGLEETDGRLHGITVQNVNTKEEKDYQVDGLFEAIGMNPQTELLKGIVDLDPSGYILAGEDTRTNVPVIFAAGDVRLKQVRQLTTAAADGTTAAIQAVSL